MRIRGLGWLAIAGTAACGCASSAAPKPESAPAPSSPAPAATPAPQSAPALKPFARCFANRCEFDFTVDLAPDGRDAELVVDRCVESTTPCATNVGRLTAAGRAAATAARDRLIAEGVESGYGCPGCADGPIFTLTLPAGASSTRHTYDPQHDSEVPEVLHGVHPLLIEGERAMARCTPSAHVELVGACIPRR